MADDKKPKIDLKARLKKADAAADATPAPPATAASSGAALPPPAVGSVPGMSGPGIPVPPGVSAASAAADPTNPLAVAAGTAAKPAPVAPQRIEVDETEVREAASKARRTGVIIGLFIALLTGGGGFAIGDASATSARRAQGGRDAADLKKNLDTAKGKLDEIAKALEDGQKQLGGKQGERKFPVDLANQLGGMKVDFDGSQLAGRSFSGFPPEAASGLVDFITGVQDMEDSKTAVKNIITKLAANKTFVEQFNAPAGGGGQAEYVVLLGGPTGKDPKGNSVALIARLAAPLALAAGGGPAADLPKDGYTAINPVTGSGNVSSPAYKTGDLTNASAMYIVPKTFDAVCPPETKSAAGQLGVKLGDLITAIRGEEKPAGDMVADTKPGLMDRVDTLSKLLEKVH
jgi:hypothetical protein